MKNTGKIFEAQFKASVPDDCLIIRLPDPPQAFERRKDTQFSHKNPFDYVLFDTYSRTLWCVECKSTKNKSITFENIDCEEEQHKMIHKHQIIGLKEYSMHEHVCAGFIFNFRHFEEDEEKYFETAYYQDIDDFLGMTRKINKKSFDEADLILHGNAIKIHGMKKRKRWYWDLRSFLRT